MENPVDAYNRKFAELVNNQTWLDWLKRRLKTDAAWAVWVEERIGPDPSVLFGDVEVVWESWQILSMPYLQFAEKEIRRTGFEWLVRLAGVKKIVINADPIPSILGEGATIRAPDTIILMDTQFFPSHDLAGSIIHEAVHLWQIETGILGAWQSTTRGHEAQAYGIEQMFFETAGYLDGNRLDSIFRRNLNAQRSFEDGIGLDYARPV